MPRTKKISRKPARTSSLPKKAWVLTVDMGYGHQRAAYPLADIAYKGIIAVNDYEGLPATEKKAWKESRKGYEWVSRLKSENPIGNAVFDLFDKLQEIPKFYPKRDLSKPSLQLLYTYRQIEKGNLCKHLFTEVLSKNDSLPLICTFFLPAFAAEIYGYKGQIYLQVCDADISRAWVPKNPQKTRIHYLAPNKRVVERLELYGVPSENIIFTGFPIPKENIGGRDCIVLKKDIGARLLNLDPNKKTFHKFGHIITYHVGAKNIPSKPTHPLTLAFAVGGAGAQLDLGVKVLKSLSAKLLEKKLNLVLVAGTRKEVAKEFTAAIKEFKLTKLLGKNLHILCEETKNEYFKVFTALLRHTDILWTKPSELSFYVGLGIPIIMAPSVGSQEDFNRVWLKTIAAGIAQDDPRYTDEWLFDWIESGWLARAAINGFVEAPVRGTYAVEDVVLGRVKNSGEVEVENELAL